MIWTFRRDAFVCGRVAAAAGTTASVIAIEWAAEALEVAAQDGVVSAMGRYNAARAGSS